MNASARVFQPANDAYERLEAAARAKPKPLAPLEDAYRATVLVHYPDADDLTIALRVKLMGLRDRAAAAVNRCCDDAAQTLIEASRLATHAALSGAPTRTLGFYASAIDQMIFAAQMIQRGQDGR